MSISPQLAFKGLQIPALLYGTAWKEAETATCVSEALKAGFRGIDTANQRKHYFEAGVGQALQTAFREGSVQRAELFLQTKYTFQNGQDHRLPYDQTADYYTQVQQSFQSSCEHLGTDYLDSFILHGPSTHSGLQSADFEAWSAMEHLQQTGKVRFLGVSNVSVEQLVQLLKQVSIPPAFVQNRCYAQMGWDAEVRRLCQEHHMLYQGFSLLTANQRELNQSEIHQLALKYELTWMQLIFAFALQIGMQPLTGTTNAKHMRQDLAASQVILSSQDLHLIEQIAYK
jgi:diketogulonate reductase-like aldo/keto reductase